MNYYPFHIGDYASATQHLTLEEDAMYRRLLDICYTSEKPLTKDERQLFRLTRAATESHREAVLTVLHEFFEETEEGWISRRAVAEITAMQEKQQKQRDKANKMWANRKAALPSAESGNASALPQHESGDAAASKGDADAMPPTPTPTPTPKKNTPLPPKGGFEAPDWIPEKPWADFVAMRRAKGNKVPFTVAAAKGIVAKLDEFRAAGHDVSRVLEESVINGWSSVFEPKAKPASAQPAAFV